MLTTPYWEYLYQPNWSTVTLGRKKIFISATVVSLVTDTPNIIQQSVLNSIVRGTDIADDIVTNLTHGVAANLNSYYHAAKRKQSEVDLFPVSSMGTLSTATLQVQHTLSQIHGTTVAVAECTRDVVDTDYLAYEYMAQRYGYNHVTGKFTSLPNGLPVATTKFGNSSLENGQLFISYVNATDVEVYLEPTTVTGINSEDTYFHVLYYVTGETTLRYWNYNTASGLYGYLTPVTYGFSDSYFPVVPIIQYGKNLTEAEYENTPQYALSKSMLKVINLDMQNISDGLKESEDYNLIKQAHFVPSIRMSDKNQLALRYLHGFFDSLYSTQKYKEADLNEWLALAAINGTATVTDAPPANLFRFSMSAFRTDLQWLHITKKVVDKAWSSDPKDTYARFFTRKPTLRYGDPQWPISRNADTITFIRKLSDTQQEELTIYGLVATTFAEDNYSKDWIAGNFFERDNDDEEQEGNDPLAIPVSPVLAQKLFPKLLERNTFYYRVYTLVLSFKKVVKLKWYQTGLFSFVLIVIAIVITVYTMGADGGSSLSAAFTAAGGGIAGALVVADILLTKALIAMGIKYLAAKVIKEFGLQNTLIIAALAAVLMYTYGDMDFSTIMGMADNVFTSISDYYADELGNLVEESKDLLDTYTEWMDEYDTMMKEMFGLSDMFSDIYREYTIDKALANRMTPSTFLFMALDAVVLAPEMAVRASEFYVDSMLLPTTKYDLI